MRAMIVILVLIAVLLSSVSADDKSISARTHTHEKLNPKVVPTDVRIACIGDSITLGEGSGDNEKLSWPALLQLIMNDSKNVRGCYDYL
jgi:hypothetical protein